MIAYNSKFSKGQYYTTNEFAEYYKNLVESKEKNSSSKISMLSWNKSPIETEQSHCFYNIFSYLTIYYCPPT